jgi:molybdopterin converting factor small subunit
MDDGDRRMKITFKLYATLQDLLPADAWKNAIDIDVPDEVTLNEVIDRYKVPRELAHLVLVNGTFQCREDRDKVGLLKENDVLAIWPPVAGG